MTVLMALLIVAAPAPVPDRPVRPPVFTKEAPKGKVSLANPHTVVAAMQAAGYKAKLVIKPNEDPYITSSSSGATFDLKFLSCKEHVNCQDAMFSSGYEKKETNPVTADQINEFNRDSRWVRAYLDKNGDPVLEQDVLFTEQLMDSKALEEHLAVWDDALGKFHKAIDF